MTTSNPNNKLEWINCYFDLKRVSSKKETIINLSPSLDLIHPHNSVLKSFFMKETRLIREILSLFTSIVSNRLFRKKGLERRVGGMFFKLINILDDVFKQMFLKCFY